MKSIIYTNILMLLISITTPLKSQTYCAAKGVFPWEQWIARVSLAPANVGNNSLKEGYGNFTSVTGFTVKRGENNLFTIDPRASWNNDPRNANIFWRVWIDYNGDGDFTDVGEQVISRQVVFTQGIFLDNETTFIVPTTARLGNTRLRVAMKMGGYPESCETFDRGEVEDYTLNFRTGGAIITPDTPDTEGSYFYQIKAVKYNGLIQNSDIKSIKIKGFNNLDLFPNPVSDELSIVLKDYQDTEAKILFYNTLGVITKAIYLDKNNNNLIKTEVNNLPTGHYYVRVIAKGKRDLIQSFIIAR